jgi:hypothetical protein
MNSFFTYQEVPHIALIGMSQFLAVAMLCCLFLSTHASAQQASDVPLTNGAVVKLVRAGFKEKTVITIIHSRTNHFKLDTEELIQLKHSGVSENIILAMLSQYESIGSGEDWSDDAFFKGNDKRSKDSGTAESQDPGTGIFGSSGGSKAETRSRGRSGSIQNEGTSTGSATVRILRPPTEAGGSVPKLERTQSLDNEAIVRLVDAGFSEGTIIKRIEDSPSEFDLSPAKLADLHKRRVTDPVIAAMSAAMGGKENENKPNAPLQDKEK